MYCYKYCIVCGKRIDSSEKYGQYKYSAEDKIIINYTCEKCEKTLRGERFHKLNLRLLEIV